MRIFVACSASDNINKKYKELTMEICTMLAREDHKLVFGGATSGMMGSAYQTFKYEGKKTKAVLELSDAPELDYLEVDAYDVTKTTFERTKTLYESCEAVLILPGGVGTLAELFSMLDEKRTKKSNIPIVIFNYENFYTPLLKVLKDMHSLLFVSEEDIKRLDIVTDVTTLKMYLKKQEKRK